MVFSPGRFRVAENRLMLLALLSLTHAVALAASLGDLPGDPPPATAAPATPAPAEGPAATVPAAGAPAASATYAPDEQMDFDVEYLGVTMGRARISVGRPAGALLPIFLQAQTGGIASIFTVRQQIVSTLEAATGLPRISKLDSLEPGGYHHVDTARFDREAGRATVREQGKYDKTYEIEVPRDTVDFLAMVFELRGLSLEMGARHEFRVLAGRKVSVVLAEVVGRETLATDAGRFATVKVRVPTGFDGKFQEKRPTYVWFSDDERRVVVRISTEFAIGRADANLVAYRPGHVAG
jgi:Protein of unknown function (DUF3108)